MWVSPSLEAWTEMRKKPARSGASCHSSWNTWLEVTCPHVVSLWWPKPLNSSLVDEFLVPDTKRMFSKCRWMSDGQMDSTCERSTRNACSTVGSLMLLLRPRFQELELQAPVAIPKRQWTAKTTPLCATYWTGALGGACAGMWDPLSVTMCTPPAGKREQRSPFVKTWKLTGKEGRCCFRMLFMYYRMRQDLMSRSFIPLKMW